MQKNHKYLKISFYIIFFMLHSLCYSFYEISANDIYTYNLTFQGDITLESHFLSYTSKDVEFSFDYTLTGRSDLVEKDHIVIDWRISPLVNQKNLSIFGYLWNYFLEEIVSEIAYSIKMPGDNFVIIDKQGEKHPLTYFLEFFFPIIDQEEKYYAKNYRLELPCSYNEPQYMFIDIEGWDFDDSFSKTKAHNLLLEKNEHFMNDIYRNYTRLKKIKTPPIFWSQRFEATIIDSVKNKITDVNLFGFYLFDSQRKILSNFKALAEIQTTLPYTLNTVVIPISVKLNGNISVNLDE